jgi:uncharacterized membrane protein
MQILRQFVIRFRLPLLISLAGISLKFYHLDHKLLWVDEVYAIQHTSGIPDKEYPTLIPENEIKNAGFYSDLYRLRRQNYTLRSQLKGLLAAPQLNPLHYPFLMVWYRIVGDDPVDFRLFSVFVFVITLPFLFLLSRELFDSRLAGWIAVSLYAVSPYLHLFAQEARYYILWSFVLVVLHLLLLQVMHRNKPAWWLAYSVVAVLSLYASPVSIVILFGHFAFVGITRKDLLRRYSISMLVVFLAYLPWALSLYFRLDAITSALSWQSNNPHHVAFWLPFFGECLYLVSIFSFKLDYLSVFEQTPSSVPPEALSALLFNSIVLALLCASFIVLVMKTRKEVRYFLLLTIIPGFLLFYINDLLRNGMTSWWWRYLMFVAPGVILVMTSLLYEKIEKGSLLYSLCYVALAVIGISSITTIANARHWHIGNTMNVYIEDARLISEAKKPLLITDLASNKSMVDLMVVLRECNSRSIDVLRASPGIDSVENRIPHREYSDIYVLYASDGLIGNLRSQFGSRMERLNVKGISPMWKIRIAE